jgi:ABC-type multidrug transport system, ATPase component
MVTLNSVTKKYGPLTAVDNVSYTIGKGEYFALLGPNGAGKTTTVKMLLDFVRPSSGVITIGGVPCMCPVARMGVGYCAENHRIPRHLTGLQYLRRVASLAGLQKKDAELKAEAMIERVGMAGKEKLEARTYSKGMVQRIALGSALITDPTLLILDEPVSGLDPIGIREVRQILEKLRESGITIILNSHFLSEVEKTCDTAAIMDKGRILIKDKLSAIVSGGESLEDVFVRLVKDGHA